MDETNFLRHPQQRRVDAQTGFGADHQEIERIGQSVAQLPYTFFHLFVQKVTGSDHADHYPQNQVGIKIVQRPPGHETPHQKYQQGDENHRERA